MLKRQKACNIIIKATRPKITQEYEVNLKVSYPTRFKLHGPAQRSQCYARRLPTKPWTKENVEGEVRRPSMKEL
jgi:hypothetical protein